MKIQETCRGCQERKPGCHATCEKYLAAKAEYEQKKKIFRDYKEKEIMVEESIIESIRKAKKRKGR